MVRAGQSESSLTLQRNYINLASYKEGDDVDVYFRTFKKVKTANSWNDAVAMSALQNGFSGTQVGQLISSLTSDTSYVIMKSEILKSFGLTVLDYRRKFKSTRQGANHFRQYVLELNNYLGRWAE